MSSILILPTIELILVGALAGAVEVPAVLGKQAFFAEAIIHAAFPGVVVGAAITAALGPSHSWIPVFPFTGAFLMCIPIGVPFGPSKVRTTSSVTGIVLTFGFVLGCSLNKWLVPLPVEVESFPVDSVPNVNKIDIALSDGLLPLVAAILAARWRQLTHSTFDPESFGVAHPRRKAQLVISGLVVSTLVALIPAVGTILSIMLLTAPAAMLAGIVDDTRLLFVLAPLMGTIIGPVGLFIAVTVNLSAGGCIGAYVDCFYVPLKVTAACNNARV